MRLFYPEPSAEHDAEVRGELADSLRYLVDAARDALCCPEIRLDEVCREIERHRLEPTVFARYYELVLALRADRPDEAKALYRGIAAGVLQEPAFRVLPFGDPAIAAESARYRRWLTARSEGASMLDAPDPDAWPEFEGHVGAALALIDRAAPPLGAELRSLVVEVIGAASSRDAPKSFGGASSFMLWGAVFLNVDVHRTRVAVAEGLVHEGAHQWLFGASCRTPLVNNALHERVASPLRSDARPVIGVYHATVVCARLAYAFAAMLRPEVGLTDEERGAVEGHLRQAKASFEEGHATLRREADLTDLGRRILDEAEAAVGAI